MRSGLIATAMFVVFAALMLIIAPVVAMVIPLSLAGWCGLSALVTAIRARRTHTELVVLCPNGFVLLDAKDVAGLGEQVSRRVADRLVPAALSTLDDGHSVRVRPFRLNRRGITIDDRQLDWAVVAEVKLAAGWFEVTEAGRRKPWANIQVAEIDNAYLLLALVASLRVSAFQCGRRAGRSAAARREIRLAAG